MPFFTKKQESCILLPTFGSHIVNFKPDHTTVTFFLPPSFTTKEGYLLDYTSLLLCKNALIDENAYHLMKDLNIPQLHNVKVGLKYLKKVGRLKTYNSNELLEQYNKSSQKKINEEFFSNEYKELELFSYTLQAIRNWKSFIAQFRDEYFLGEWNVQIPFVIQVYLTKRGDKLNLAEAQKIEKQVLQAYDPVTKKFSKQKEDDKHTRELFRELTRSYIDAFCFNMFIENIGRSQTTLEWWDFRHFYDNAFLNTCQSRELTKLENLTFSLPATVFPKFDEKHFQQMFEDEKGLKAFQEFMIQANEHNIEIDKAFIEGVKVSVQNIKNSLIDINQKYSWFSYGVAVTLFLAGNSIEASGLGGFAGNLVLDTIQKVVAPVVKKYRLRKYKWYLFLEKHKRKKKVKS